MSFSESLEPNEGLLPNGQPLKLTEGKSYEGGIKFEHPTMDLSFDASIYRIELKNVTTEAPNNPGFEIQTAKQISEGFEMELSIKPKPWF